MATASTKSRARKQKGQGSNAGQVNETGDAVAPPPQETAGGELSPRAWRIAYAVIMLVATLVRVYRLELRPMHHDEGVNGFFLMNLIRTGVYRYDPSNYHGPTLYYFTLPLAAAAEHYHILSTWVVRAVPLVFGLATVWLALCLRRHIGSFGALAAAALLALSPGVVFFSRYFIHEMMFAFFTFGVVVAALRFYEHDARGGRSDAALGVGIAAASLALVAASLVAAYQPDYYWYALTLLLFSLGVTLVLLWTYDGARSVYLVLASLSAALLFATKETAFISVGVLLIAWAMAWGYASLARRAGWFGAREAVSKRGKNAKGRGASGTTEAGGLVKRLGGWPRVLILLSAALGIFLFVNILYYSSFFTNPKGVKDSLAAFDIWTKTGKSEFHAKPFYKYVQWLVYEESPVLLLAVAGAAIAVWRARNRFAVFAALWGFGLLAAYSLINYKTPWLSLSMLVPFAVVGGYGLNVLYRKGDRTFALGALGVALAVCSYQTYMLNFVHYDEDAYIYVYAHTHREYLDLIAQVNRISERTGKKFETNINVAAPEYWPMPWYLRDYKHVGYQGRVIPTTNDDIIIASDKQQAEMQASLGARYQQIGTYSMRPGVTLALYTRRDLAGQ